MTIFRSTSQALHVAFLMEGTEPRAIGPTQSVISRMRELCGKPEAYEPSSLNTEGMTSQEFANECAHIRRRVQELPISHERHAIWARYGRHVPSQRVWTWRDGVRGLCDYLHPLTGIDCPDTALALCHWVYQAPLEKKDQFSLRTLSDESGVTVKALETAAGVIRRNGKALEACAFRRLDSWLARKVQAMPIEA